MWTRGPPMILWTPVVTGKMEDVQMIETLYVLRYCQFRMDK